MRSTKLPPSAESCEKNLLRTIAREWRRAAVESLRLSRRGRRSRRARSAFSTHRVARTSARLLASDAEALGTLRSRLARAAATPAAGLEKLMHGVSRCRASDLEAREDSPWT